MAAASTRARIFLSYSRKNSAYVDELIISLESYGYEILLDRQDLFPGEQWEPRLRKFIADADTTVCIVSSDWVASDQCVRELRIALDHGRRVIPVVVDPVAPQQMPPEIARLQLVFFIGPGRSYARGVADLVNALQTDIEWVREQTRLLDKAQEWAAIDRTSALLLRGAALERALRWLETEKPAHTEVLPIVAEFVAASRQSQDDDEKKRLRARLGVVSLAGTTVAAVLIAIAVVLNGQKQDAVAEAQTQQSVASFAVAQANLAEQDGASGTNAEPAPSEPGSSPVKDLNAADAGTRVRAGQAVVEAVRGAQDPAILGELVGQLQLPRLEELTASGRFNVLYMLNVYNDWPQSRQAEPLRAALATIERRATGANPLVIGAQTRDCIDKLRAKLAGQTGVEDRCGGR
jgi:TIR domain-containing protein